MNESNDVTMRGENVPEAMVTSAVVAQPVASGESTPATAAAPFLPKRRRGSGLARFFVLLGMLLLLSAFVLPLLADAMGSSSNLPARALFFSAFYLVPFSFISFLLALFAKLAQMLREKE